MYQARGRQHWKQPARAGTPAGGRSGSTASTNSVIESLTKSHRRAARSQAALGFCTTSATVAPGWTATRLVPP